MKKNLQLSILLMCFITHCFSQVSADSALHLLKVGNERFVDGKSLHPNQNKERIKEVASGQKPFAIIVGCSDSRVPSEIIFDQGLGDLFIVRTAGQVSSYASWGSIEFANAVLGAKLIVVLGHTKCGAVKAACDSASTPGHIPMIINEIKPAADLAKKQEGHYLDNAVKINVAMEVEQLKNLNPLLKTAVDKGELKIVGAVYNLENGKIEFIDENYLSSLKK